MTDYLPYRDRSFVRAVAGRLPRFASGAKAWIDVEVTAHERCGHASVHLALHDEKQALLFVTTTELLGHPAVTLNAGDVLSCTLEADLNYGRGLLYVNVTVGRFTITPEVYDRWEAAATLHVSSPEIFFGPVNCFPRVVTHTVRRATDRLPEPGGVMTHDGAQLAAF